MERRSFQIYIHKSIFFKRKERKPISKECELFMKFPCICSSSNFSSKIISFSIYGIQKKVRCRHHSFLYFMRSIVQTDTEIMRVLMWSFDIRFSLTRKRNTSFIIPTNTNPQSIISTNDSNCENCESQDQQGFFNCQT